MLNLISGNENILALMYAMSSDLDLKDNSARLENLRAVVENSAEVKPSVFNYHVEAAEKFLIYNTLYNSMTWLTKEEFAQLGGEIFDDELRRNFLESGICVAANVDERANYHKWRILFQKKSEHLSVNITTTLKCNARCPYCYEHGVKHIDFDDTKIDALIDFIKRHKKNSPVKLNWFGGEPFMNPKIIDTVTRRLGEIGFPFFCYAITNGNLLTRQMINTKFKQWHIRGVQITLDGTAEQYAARKNYTGNQRDVFKKILNRIQWLAEANIHVDVRLNIDRQNLCDMLNLIYILQARFDGEKNICYYPAFVTGLQDKLTETEKLDFVKEMFNAVANSAKLSITNRLYSFPRSIPCMRNDPQSFSVDVYGRIYNCEHLVGRAEKSLGTLKRLPTKINDARLEENLREECGSCVFLPKCMGGCASNLETGDSACLIEKYLIKAYMQYMCER